MSDKKNLLSKLPIIISVLSLCAFVLLVRSKSPSEYELSFYTNIPAWYFLIITIGFSFFTVYLFFCEKYKKLLILFLAFLFTFTIGALWIIKYGRAYGIGDIYIHLYNVKKIYETAHLSADNFYPIMHIFLFTVSSLTDIDTYYMIIWTSPLILSSLVIFAYIIGKEIFNKKIGCIASLLAILSPLIMQPSGGATPWILSLFFLMISLFLFVKILKNTRLQFQILLVVISSIMVFTHILTSILFFSTLLSFYIIWTLLNKLYFKKSVEKNYWLISTAIFIILLISIWIFFINPYARRLFINAIKTFTLSFSTTASVEQTSVTTRSFGQFIVRRVNIVTTTLLAAVTILYGLKNLIKNKKSKFKNIRPYLFIVTFLGICMVFYFAITIFLSREFGVSGRFIWIASLLYPVIIGYGVYKSVFHKKVPLKKFAFKKFLIILLVSLFFLTSILEIYPRPDQGYYSPYTTDNDFVGMKWGYTHMNHSNSKIMGGGDQFNALALYMFGRENYEMFRGSTNGFLEFLGYSPADYRHRGTNEHYIPGHKSQFIYYEPLMAYYLANPKYAKSIVTVQQTELDTREDLQKIYDSKDFSTYNLRS